MVKQNLIRVQVTYILGGGKALTSSSVPLQDIFLMIKRSHAIHDSFLIDAILPLSEEPTSMVFKLRVGVAQELILETPACKEPIPDDRMDVTEDVVVLLLEIESLFKVLLHKAEPNELVMIIFVLAQDFV